MPTPQSPMVHLKCCLLKYLSATRHETRIFLFLKDPHISHLARWSHILIFNRAHIVLFLRLMQQYLFGTCNAHIS